MSEWEYNPITQVISDVEDEFYICQIRGWGYYTGKGHAALGLSEEEAIRRQDLTGERIAKLPELEKCAKEMIDALKEAGDVIEAYHKNTGVDLGEASRMPFYKDTIEKIDKAIANFASSLSNIS